jgi:hypothetical protein
MCFSTNQGGFIMKKATKQSTQSNGSQPRATQQSSTSKNAQPKSTQPLVDRDERRRRAWAELDELHHATLKASRISQDCDSDIAAAFIKDTMRALTPVRYLSEFAFDHYEKVDGHAVHGTLKLFLQHMDELLLRRGRFCVRHHEKEVAKAS